MSARRASAFSLLELMIALAIVAVTAAYALPAYWTYAARGHRMEAILALYRAAQFIETTASAGTIGPLPAGLDQTPPEGTPVYRLRALPADSINGGYAIQAQPSAGGPMQGDRCGTFILDATGRRSNRAPAAPAVFAQDCWLAR